MKPAFALLLALWFTAYSFGETDGATRESIES